MHCQEMWASSIKLCCDYKYVCSIQWLTMYPRSMDPGKPPRNHSVGFTMGLWRYLAHLFMNITRSCDFILICSQSQVRLGYKVIMEIYRNVEI